MSDYNTNSLESTSDLDSMPLVKLLEDESENANPIHNVDIIESVDDTGMDFMSETVTNEDDSTAGSGSPESEMIGIDEENTKSSESDANAAASLDELPIDIPDGQKVDVKPNPPESWPTLEILPGGVIKNAEKEDEYPCSIYQDSYQSEDQADMMYACAKCPERFKFLYSLVKHVRWHEDERKREEGHDLSKLTAFEKELICIKRARSDMERKYKKTKIEVMARIADAFSDFDDFAGLLH